MIAQQFLFFKHFPAIKSRHLTRLAYYDIYKGEILVTYNGRYALTFEHYQVLRGHPI